MSPRLLSAGLLAKENYETRVKKITFTGDGRESRNLATDGRYDLSLEQLDAGFV